LLTRRAKAIRHSRITSEAIQQLPRITRRPPSRPRSSRLDSIRLIPNRRVCPPTAASGWPVGHAGDGDGGPVAFMPRASSAAVVVCVFSLPQGETNASYYVSSCAAGGVCPKGAPPQFPAGYAGGALRQISVIDTAGRIAGVATTESVAVADAFKIRTIAIPANRGIRRHTWSVKLGRRQDLVRGYSRRTDATAATKRASGSCWPWATRLRGDEGVIGSLSPCANNGRGIIL